MTEYHKLSKEQRIAAIKYIEPDFPELIPTKMAETPKEKLTRQIERLKGLFKKKES